MKYFATALAAVLAAPIVLLGVCAAAAWVVWKTPLVDAEAFNTSDALDEHLPDISYFNDDW